MMIDNYAIKNNYISRKSYNHYDDTINEDEWQLEVYQKAKTLMASNNFNDVIDIGCGSGFKLIKYLGKYNTIGTELMVNLNFLKRNYPQRTWIESDFGNGQNISCDIAICSDVIEHLINPNDLMNYLLSIDFKILLISTPQRELVYEKGSKYLNGPPRNVTHVREWNFIEFENYVKKFFEIVEHYISNKNQWTQLIICKKY
jgi:2-polyprenyl-3-methyl-5-hydroxy-6-metoxy-1,4-benzoquinol methylase